MSDPAIYALKGGSECAMLSALAAGEGRFGWSYAETADLRVLKARIDASGWSSLSHEEKDCYQGFLLDLRPGDYVVYVNTPERGKCTLARVVGEYCWRYEDRDFNHRFPVDPLSVQVFDRNDEIVHPNLSARLKLQGRYWRIYCKKEFFDLERSLKIGGGSRRRTSRTNVDFLVKEIQPLLLRVTEEIQRTHPSYDLEGFVAKAFKNVVGVKEVKWQGGSGDHGADIIVIFETGLPIPGLQQQRICLVQVKSYVGAHWDTRAVSDIRRAFDHYPEADMGLIISTASHTTLPLEEALDRLRKDLDKPVALLIGADVAAFCLRFGLIGSG